MNYFEEEEGIDYIGDNNINRILETIAQRYIGNNAPIDYTYRASNINGFKREKDYKYLLDFNKLFSNVPNEYFVYAWSAIWADEEKNMGLSINCFGPIEVYCNGEKVYRSTINEENDSRLVKYIPLKLKKAYNHIVIRCKKTNSGFGCKIGTASMKGAPFAFIIDTKERKGQEGFLYTEPIKKALDEIPSKEMSEKETKISWLPDRKWSKKLLKKGQFERMYGKQEIGAYAFGYSKAIFKKRGEQTYVISGKTLGKLIVYLDSEMIFQTEQAGDFSTEIQISSGEHSIVFKSYNSEDGWGYIIDENENIEMKTPMPIKGVQAEQIYAGVFVNEQEIDIERVQDISSVFEANGVTTYFRVDYPNLYVRPFLEGKSQFAKWNYPLGVTLYGILRSGIKIGREDMVEYVRKHIEQCTGFYKYSLWDKKTYGASAINHQISAVDSLDDCGSFASAMLELMQNRDIKDGEAVAQDVYDYIHNKQARLEDGALYRKNCFSPFMEDTMWADDLYMSIPFLSRYYKLTGKKEAIDDAAKQFLLFKKYLYMPDKKIMAHVYNFRCNSNTGVAWGRGNGWVAFSLTELLEILPKKHKLRPELISFFRELCEGYLALQDEYGMWHQVLTDSSSYMESSCTSMFTYAFSRGIRFGWLEDTQPYEKAVYKAWKALTKFSIDKYGNIYGICKGSGYSYTPEYYKNELPWVLNDTHGIGIVMLAGIEVLELNNWRG